MDSISDPRLPVVVVKSSSQVGKTELLLNIAGYHIDQDPAPILFLQPTMSMAQSFSKDRLTPMCRDTPALQGKLTEAQRGGAVSATAKGSTLLQKVYPGGHISLAGMNAPSELASRPVRIVLIDEVDRAPSSVGGSEGEGDPVNLARKRSTTFWNRKTILVSTPTTAGQSRIDAEYQESDKRRFFVPCPHCDEFQTLDWEFVIWPDGEPSKAKYTCRHCGAAWTDAERWRAVAKGHWSATADFTGIAGFHISEIYSPWSRLGEMATNFIIAKRSGNQDQLKAWINTSLGECWEPDEGEKVDWEVLHQRREHYPHGDQVPEQVIALVAGIDVQDDRIEYEVVGYGMGEECWGISYRILIGDPGRPDIWLKLEAQLRETFMRGDEPIGIRQICIDSGGHYTDEVYRWSRKVGRTWAIPIKGSSEAGRQVATFPRGPRRDSKVYLTMIGTDTAKEHIYGCYRNTEPGPGYCHYPVSDEYDERYFQQATAERRIRKYRKGREVFEWVAGARRNEALDCRVYALAAVRILQQNMGVKLRHKRNTKKVDPEKEPPPENAPRARPERTKDRRRKKWAGYEGKW